MRRQEREGAGTPLVKQKDGLLRAICSRCAKDPNVDVEPNDRFKEKGSDVPHNGYQYGDPLDCRGVVSFGCVLVHVHEWPRLENAFGNGDPLLLAHRRGPVPRRVRHPQDGGDGTAGRAHR